MGFSKFFKNFLIFFEKPLHFSEKGDIIYLVVKRDDKTKSKQLVSMTLRVHLFPSRTQKLSSVVPKIVGWKRPVKIGRCQHQQVSIQQGRHFSFVNFIYPIIISIILLFVQQFLFICTFYFIILIIFTIQKDITKPHF